MCGGNVFYCLPWSDNGPAYTVNACLLSLISCGPNQTVASCLVKNKHNISTEIALLLSMVVDRNDLDLRSSQRTWAHSSQ